RLGFQAQTLHVAHYADNRARRRQSQDPFAKRIFAAEVAMSQRFVDDQDAQRFFVVQFGDTAPGAQLHAHRAKVIRTDKSNINLWSLLSGRRRPPFYTEQRLAAIAGEGNTRAGYSCDLLDAGYSFDPCENLLVESM